MIDAPTPSQALATLATQHAELREMIARCEDLADELDSGRIEPSQLLREVATLRVAFDTHNRFEERVLHPVLLDADWSGAVRVARMVEDHIEEHRSMRRDLDATASWELRAVLTSLRAHLDSEERYFLNKRVLRNDFVR
jgi:iron-sulfur cluster repair protein YtfE (RIC family)